MAEIKDLKRMCNAYINCEGCPFAKVRPCIGFMCKHTEEADRIITEWCNEHPEKTYAMDFFEKFPNAIKAESGRPYFCRAHIYGDELECHKGGCEKCWNQKMEG